MLRFVQFGEGLEGRRGKEKEGSGNRRKVAPWALVGDGRPCKHEQIYTSVFIGHRYILVARK